MIDYSYLKGLQRVLDVQLYEYMGTFISHVPERHEQTFELPAALSAKFLVFRTEFLHHVVPSYLRHLEDWPPQFLAERGLQRKATNLLSMITFELTHILFLVPCWTRCFALSARRLRSTAGITL